GRRGRRAFCRAEDRLHPRAVRGGVQSGDGVRRRRSRIGFSWMSHEGADALADSAGDVTVSAPKVLAEGFHALERFSMTLRSAGREPLASVRDVLRVGKVTAVLPIDLKRREVVLLRQFRLPAHLATGLGELTEIVAGHVESGETPAEGGMRECVE